MKKIIYLIKAAEPLDIEGDKCQPVYKIGKSEKFKRRLRGYKTHCPGYKVIDIICVTDKINETSVFSRFDKFRRIDLEGTEFFSYVPEILNYFHDNSILNEIYLGNIKLREVKSLKGIIDDIYLSRIKPDFISGAIRKPLENRLIYELMQSPDFKINIPKLIRDVIHPYRIFPFKSMQIASFRHKLGQKELDLNDPKILSAIDKYFWGYIITEDGKIITGQEKVLMDIANKIRINL